MKRGFDATSRLRREVSGTLVQAARAAGARRIVAQSISFAYRPGPGVRTEADPLWTDAEGQIGALTNSVATLESTTQGDPGARERRASLRLLLRSRHLLRARRPLRARCSSERLLPMPGNGAGIFGMLHIDDAASATVAALDGPTGVFNVVDDVPAPASEWMPIVAGLIGAQPPRHVPESLVRLGAGKFLAYLMCDQPAVSNLRARSELGWAPRYPDWHDGLAAVFSDS